MNARPARRPIAFRRPALLAWIMAFAAATALAAIGLFTYLGPLPHLDQIGSRQPAPASRILDRNGLLLYEIIDPARGSYQPVSLGQIAPACVQATIATEDRRFYQHPGVDLLAIGRALLANLRTGETIQGGSTLSQQLARILLLDQSERYQQSLKRKLREAILAWRLERRFGKDEILALYLNNVYYGHYANGIEAAARAYFGRPASGLDLAQCALLAGLPQYPAGYNPIENPEAAQARQGQVLALMVDAGFIDQKTAAAAAAEPLHYAATPFPIEAPHFVFYVQRQLEMALGQARLARGGLSVITTLDLPLQQQAEAIVRRRLAELNRPGPDLPLQRRAENAALVALDPKTGALIALVGSPNYFDASIAGAVNGALALRQPGSAMKPITYAVALDPALSAAAGRQPLTPASILADVPGSFLTREGDYYTPLNYDLTFRGPASLRQALASSYNMPAVRVLQVIGVEAFVQQSRRHGVTTFGPAADYGLAITLGGGEVRLLELTAAFAPFANRGHPVRPLAIARIEDASGVVLFDAGLAGDARPLTPASGEEPGQALAVAGTLPAVLDARTAYLITDILSDNAARAPAFGVTSALRLPPTQRGQQRPAAVKTGTTTDWRDNWTIGYTPDLLAGVWVGNADNTPMYGASGVDGAAPIWHDFMALAHRALPVRAFARPEGLVEVEVCAPSGLLPSPDCPRLARELFIAGAEPTQLDDQYRRLAVDVRTGRPADQDTPATATSYRIAWNPPPEFRDWAQTQGMLLAADGGATASASGPGVLAPVLQVLSPEPNTLYVADPRLPAGSQQLQLAVAYAGAETLRRVSYVLNGQPVAEVEAWPWRGWWPLAPGAYTLEAVAESQSGEQYRAEPVRFRVE